LAEKKIEVVLDPKSAPFPTKKIVLTEAAEADLKKVAHKTGTTPEKAVEKIITENTGHAEPSKSHREKPQNKKEPEKPKAEPKAVFPAEGKINKYGFIRVSQEVAEVMGVKVPFGKDAEDTTIEFIDYKDGVLHIRKK
jgi:hypothetical protein